MPGPIIRDTTPYWLKPENASVLDSPLVKAVRALATITGMNDPQQAVFGAMNPTPVAIGLVPRQPVSELVARLAKDTPIENGAMPEAVRNAIVYLSERYPRLMSHIGGVSHAPRAGAGFDFVSSPIATYEGFQTSKGAKYGVKPKGRIGAIRYDSQAMDTSMTASNAMAHEVAHAAQDLSQTDRAWRTGAPTFMQDYLRLHDLAGYARNPYEQMARRVGSRHADQSFVMRAARKFLDQGMSVDDTVAAMQRLHGTTLSMGGIEDPRELKRLVNVAKTMAQRAKE